MRFTDETITPLFEEIKHCSIEKFALCDKVANYRRKMMENTFSYETMPYPSKFFLQTHPDRLAVLATLFGMNPPQIENCRILELGCGNGSNLIAHGFNLPKAEFVGVDLAKVHIAEGKEIVKKLNLENIKLFQMDVTKMSVEEFGKFDYIIAHGLFSWIPEFVREKVLQIYREMLTENGVGYISYNAFPGAHLRDMTRNMMRFHTAEISEPLEKVGSAISFLSLLTENNAGNKSYKTVLEGELERHFKHETSDIFHDDLADVYRPFYFHEFAALLAANDLQYLSEAEFHAMSVNNFPPDVRDFLSTIDDVIKREQYLDFFRGRVFRQTLFCRKEIELNRQITPEILNNFLVSSALHPVAENAEIDSTKAVKFVGAKGIGLEIDHPLTKAALVHLGKIWGRAISFSELLEIAKQMIGNVEDFQKESTTTRAIFYQIFSNTDFIELHLFQPQANTEAGEKPKINDLSRLQMQQANNVSTLLNLDLQIDDEVSRRLLELLDGTRNNGQLLKEMTSFIETNDEIDDKQDLLNNLENWLDDSIRQLAKLGMFDS